MRGFLAVAALAVVATACNGSDDTDSAEFCEQIRMLDAMESSDDDLGAALEQFDALIADAPDEVRGDLEVVSGALSEIVDLDEDDPDSFAAFIEVFNRPEVIEASENLETYGVEVCGLDPTDDETTSSDGDAGDSDEIESAAIGDDGPIDEADAVPLCEAILEYAEPIEPDVTITVGDGTDPLATGNVADGCSASS